MRHEAIYATHPTVTKIADTVGAFDKDGNNVEIDESLVQTKIAELQAAYPIQELRQKRTQLLAETDWVVIRARENGGQVPAAWKTYRVALRDLPSGLDTVEKVNAVTWPTKPS